MNHEHVDFEFPIEKHAHSAYTAEFRVSAVRLTATRGYHRNHNAFES